MKAWLNASWEDFKSHMKNGGWKKGAAVASVAIVAPIVLAGCVLETQATEVVVQDKEFASFDQVQAFLGDEYSINQTIKETVEDYAKDTYGQNAKVFSVVSQGKNTLEGNIFAVVENEGKIHVLEIENNTDLSMFKGKEYKADTYSFENNTLKFSVDGKEQTVDLVEIPYVYDGETGNLTTFENINSFENALSGAVKSANEIETLSNSMDASQKEIFNLVVSTFASENFKAQFPTINASYNAQTDTTTAEFKFAKGTNEITTMTFLFAGDVTNGDGTLNLDKVQVDKDTNYTQNTTTICDEYKEIYSNKDAVINSTEITKENEGEQGGESSVVEEKFESILDFISEIDSENLESYKTAVSESIRNNIFTQDDIFDIYGGGSNLSNTETVKFAFVYNDNEEIYQIQYLGGRNFTTGNQKLVQVIIDLKSPISKDSFSKKIYNKNDTKPIIEGEKIVGLNYKDQKIILNSYQFVTLDENQNCILYDYSNCINSLVKDNVVNIEIGNTMTGAIKLEENNEQKDLFNLLMPYAVSEKTTYSHITVSYRSSTDSEYGTCFAITVTGFNDNTNCYEYWNFKTDDTLESGKTAIEKIFDAVNKGDVKFGQAQNKEMIYGDIMLEMEENQDVYTITPVMQAEKE